MLPQPEFKTVHEHLHRLALGERSERKIIPEIVRLNAHKQPAGAQDTEHCVQRIERRREVHQHGLAGDNVEAAVGKWQLSGVTLLKGK